MSIDEDISCFVKEMGEKYKTLNSVHNDSSKFIPGVSTVLYAGPYFDEREFSAAIKALLVSKWLVAGENVQSFERKFAHRFNERSACMTNSGSSANMALLAAMKIFFNWPDDSEVIVSPVGFPTTVSTIYQNRLKPVFVDIEYDTLNFDLDLVEEKINSRTVAIFASPALGNPPDFDRLTKICKDNDLQFILDGCDSLGSKFDGKYLNEFSFATTDSLYVAHTISSIQGGLVSSKNKEFIALVRRLITWSRGCYCESNQNMLPLGICGKRFSNWLSPEYEEIVDHRYTFPDLGFNFLPIDAVGAVANVQLDKIDEIFENRQNSYKTISALIKKYIPEVEFPKVLDKADPVFFATGMIAPNKIFKDKLVNHFEKSKIQTRNLFAGNLLNHKGFSFMDDSKKYPLANTVLDRVLFIGASPNYNNEIFNYIEEVLSKFER